MHKGFYLIFSVYVNNSFAPYKDCPFHIFNSAAITYIVK